jgi:hypothetical protein
MKMDRTNFKKIVEILDNSGFDYRSYSGRCMYGDRCLGITCDNAVKCVAEICWAINDNVEELEEAQELIEFLIDARSDSMGLDSIVYFPNIAWFDGIGDNSDDTEDEE